MGVFALMESREAAGNRSSAGLSATSAEPKGGLTTQKNACVRRFARAKAGHGMGREWPWAGRSEPLGLPDPPTH